MKKSNKIIYIALIFVVITMIVIGYLILTSNGKIIKQKEGETKAATTSGSNSYITTEQHLSEVSFTDDANATAAQILSGKIAYVKGNKITGTMANRGAITQTLNAGGSYTIPAGYHNGSGKVTANSIASQTSATAAPGQILKDKTAWVNGSKLTGTMTNRGAVNTTLKGGGTYTIPAGYHNGSGKVTVSNVIKSWCPNYGNFVNSENWYTTDTYTVNATSLYVLVRVENGGTTGQQAAPTCSDGTVTTLINSGNAVLYHISKSASATFTLCVQINRNYSQYPNSTLKVYAFIPQ